ncbi:plant intracellular Ras-group-related LRR 7 [Olea europaea subsp. europaea]|uniref:Plant intracellular Ras-group-related LRR 7 n=1 Tax=Olea europaea subsp. europaea TaxID=158383 RepID=A0A8S0VEE3_OLEEU|nr:plant intracellular Ras-group-related LRR 7 [Olea europaea subsp. europaea]
MKSISSLQGSNDNRIRFLLLPCLVKNVLRTFYFRAGPWVIIDIVVSKLSLWETGRISYFGKQNSIEELPASVCNLVHLKSLSLNNNNVRQVPPDLLKECKSLQNISLHGNPIVMDQFQQMEGFQDFESRRKKKFDKQIDSNVMISSKGLDEGVDL